MKIKNVELSIVCGITSTLPETDRVEIAFAGKSNVGKSSLINAMINRKSLARTSAQPGKTQTINFYNVESELYFVDLPGYGYAKVSHSEKERWAVLIDDYLALEKNIRLVIFLVDIRHDPTQDDMVMYNFLFKMGLPFCVVATKSDKLSKSQIRVQLRRIANIFKLGEDNILPVSNEKKTGMEEVKQKIQQALSVESFIGDEENPPEEID